MNKNINFCKCNAFVPDDEIWKSYAETKDVSLRNQILESYLYIISTNIKRMNLFFSSREDIEDITGQGILEMINCIERYDYTRGAQFDTYASIRIRGCIIDYIRKKNWVPRDVRKRVKDLSDFEDEYQSRYGRLPSDEEIAKRLHIGEDEVQRIRTEGLGFCVLTFEDLIQTNEMKLVHINQPEEPGAPEGEVLADEFRDMIAKFIGELDKNEKTVVSLHYYEELKLKEIAFVMNLTPARISQIHAKALNKLKVKISKYMNN